MYYYIVNPAAGKGAANGLQDKLKARLRQLGIDGEFAKTTGPGDATKMAQQAIERGSNTVVVIGGDGTVNEVVNGMTSNSAAIGVIPIGTSNLLAQRLGINSWQQACEVLAARRLTSYGLIAAGQHFFLSTLTLGFETDLDKNIDRQEGGTLGSRLGKFVQGWGQASEYEPLKAKIVIDDHLEIEAPVFSLTITNRKFDDPLADNQLVMTLIDKPNRRQLSAHLWSMLKKDEIEDGVTKMAAKRIVIETKPSTGLMIDGKLSGRTPIAIRLTDRQVKFITEKQTSGFRP